MRIFAPFLSVRPGALIRQSRSCVDHTASCTESERHLGRVGLGARVIVRSP